MNKPLDEAAAKEICLKYMEQSFTFINGKKSLICCGHSLKYPNPISDARRVHILHQFDYAHIGHVGAYFTE